MSPATTTTAPATATKRLRYTPLEMSWEHVSAVLVIFAVTLTLAWFVRGVATESTMIQFARELEQNFGKGTTTAAQKDIMEKLLAHRQDVVGSHIEWFFKVILGWIIVGVVLAVPNIINCLVNDFVLDRLALVHDDGDKAEAAPVPGPAQPVKDAPAHEDDAPGGSLDVAAGDD